MQTSKLTLPQAVAAIKYSSLFDREWYLHEFPDVSASQLSPEEHYLRIGWRIGRNPGPNFSTNDYIKANPDLINSGSCPLLHCQGLGNYRAPFIAPQSDHRTQGFGSASQSTDPASQRNADVAIVEKSALFDADWYHAHYPDTKAKGVSAAQHYLLYGAKLALNPGPDFSTRFYLHKHTDIRGTGINPLVHYEKYGRREGRVILPAYLDRADTDPAVNASIRQKERSVWAADAEIARRHLTRQLGATLLGEPVRMYQNFDAAHAKRFVAALEICENADTKDQELVSIIMPTYNRAPKISTAVDSIMRQSWTNFELIIVDDGSTDNTSDVLSTYEDPRIRIFHSRRGGVSAARNEGLSHARGAVIFYLDSDNEWTRDFLWIMMRSMQHSGAACGYAGTRLQAPSGHFIGYRGEPFNWESCLQLNYVDMNVFCHRREMYEHLGGFDIGLRRMVDWDIILRYTRNEHVFYAPFIGCIYIEDSFDMNRITTSQPIAFRKIVHDKNALALSLKSTIAHIKFNISIKIFAPYHDRDAWGDYHFADSLAESLRILGHNVRIDYREQWYGQQTAADEVAIVLRGLEPYRPHPTQISIFWGISHPDTVPPPEYAGYQAVFVASRSYAELLTILLDRQVHAMWQCTDADRFSPPEASVTTGSSLVTAGHGLFIGNSRREYRQIVRWAIESGLPLDVIGQDWEDYVPERSIRATNAPNKELAALYGSASFVLNDHWASMRDFGYVSNRVFDVLAAGGQLISDKVPSIEALFGNAVLSVSSAEELRRMVDDRAMTRESSERRRLSDSVRQNHSFMQRAETFDRWLRNYLAPAHAVTPEPGLATSEIVDRWTKRVRVGLLAQWREPELLNMAIERLIAPLTSDLAATQLQLLRLESAEELLAADIDVLLVAADSCPWDADVHAAVVSRLDQNVPVFLDTVFPSTPGSMECLVPRLSGIWCDSEATRQNLPDACPVTVTQYLDPRIWRLYRTPRPIEADHGMLRLLMVCGSDTTPLSPARISAALGLALESSAVSLKIVGTSTDELPAGPRLSRAPWPENCAGYAQRARWLLDNVSADAGLIFGDAINSDGQILRMMALGLIPVVIAPASGSLARSPTLADLVEICETEAELPAVLQRLAENSTRLLEKRRNNLEHLWQNYSSLTYPDSKLSTIISAAHAFRSKVSA